MSHIRTQSWLLKERIFLDERIPWRRSKYCRRFVRSMISISCYYLYKRSRRTVFENTEKNIYGIWTIQWKLFLQPLRAISVPARYCPADIIHIIRFCYLEPSRFFFYLSIPVAFLPLFSFLVPHGWLKEKGLSAGWPNIYRN